MPLQVAQLDCAGPHANQAAVIEVVSPKSSRSTGSSFVMARSAQTSGPDVAGCVVIAVVGGQQRRGSLPLVGKRLELLHEATDGGEVEMDMRRSSKAADTIRSIALRFRRHLIMELRGKSRISQESGVDHANECGCSTVQFLKRARVVHLADLPVSPRIIANAVSGEIVPYQDDSSEALGRDRIVNATCFTRAAVDHELIVANGPPPTISKN